MLKTRFFQILFSLAIIAGLTLAIAPAPAYALSASTNSIVAGGSPVHHASVPNLTPSVLVCRILVVRHNGHITLVRRCHHIDRQE